ncbi:protein kinase [Spirulina sp. CS-785/01]|uniref:serine/threonine protein kinase n=1 Tax=Spirulina sp. CS-785/01 TaxID=3021716 RepID=UPI00232BDEC4|nr:serine/threonine protein kinase [Spirulina sp. CS-785/01]MDB9314272.1 protein kinase [Spirulina sp. CS-785/01]
MEIICTRPTCPNPRNLFPDLDDPNTLKTSQQRYCTSCGMELILGGRYLPVQLLGQGGFGAAFLARDRYSARLQTCVVKQFLPSGDLDPKSLEKAQNLFEQEALVLEEIGREHKQIPDSFAYFPVVVASQDGKRQDQFFYLVQEYIDGEDLEQEQAHKGSYSEEEVLEVMAEVLGILSFIHQKNVLHRDIKPSNIMRDKNGRLYLLDFGAVKQVTAGAGQGTGRSTGIYSMGYAPPEQMQGAQVYPSTDLYALAATCLVLLTGKPTDELFDAYNNCWEWRSHAPQVSDRLANILDTMLNPIPRDRFQSARDVLQAFSQETSPPPPQSAPTQAPPSQTSPHATTSQNPNPVTSPPPSVASGGGGGQFPTTQPTQNPPTSTPPSPSPSPVQTGSTYSLMEFLGGAAFTGFEGAMLHIALSSLLGSVNPVSVGLLGMSLGGLIYAQYRRWIEKFDLIIIGGVSWLLVAFIPFLSGNAGIETLIATMGLPNFVGVLFIGVLAGAVVVAIATLFRLVYQMLSQIL